MIAPLKRPPLQQPCPKQPASDRSADPFEAMLPEVCLYAWASFRRLEPEAREEAVQEAVAHALLTYRRLVAQGKADVAYPAVLARCGVLRVKDGRKVVGGQNGRDVLSPYCQRRKNIAVERLDRFDKESGEWIEAIVEDARTPVPDQVAFRIDFPAWLCLQTKRNRRIAEALAVGHTNGQVARRFKLSPARISQLRQDFHQSWQEFYGETAAVTA